MRLFTIIYRRINLFAIRFYNFILLSVFIGYFLALAGWLRTKTDPKICVHTLPVVSELRDTDSFRIQDHDGFRRDIMRSFRQLCYLLRRGWVKLFRNIDIAKGVLWLKNISNHRTPFMDLTNPCFSLRYLMLKKKEIISYTKSLIYSLYIKLKPDLLNRTLRTT